MDNTTSSDLLPSRDIITSCISQKPLTIHQKRDASLNKRSGSSSGSSHSSTSQSLSLKKQGLLYRINDRGQMIPFVPRKSRSSGVFYTPPVPYKEPVINTRARHQASKKSTRPVRMPSLQSMSKQIETYRERYYDKSATVNNASQLKATGSISTDQQCVHHDQSDVPHSCSYQPNGELSDTQTVSSNKNDSSNSSSDIITTIETHDLESVTA